MAPNRAIGQHHFENICLQIMYQFAHGASADDKFNAVAPQRRTQKFQLKIA